VVELRSRHIFGAMTSGHVLARRLRETSGDELPNSTTSFSPLTFIQANFAPEPDFCAERRRVLRTKFTKLAVYDMRCIDIRNQKTTPTTDYVLCKMTNCGWHRTLPATYTIHSLPFDQAFLPM
jgi:hypothetical protein